jgi:hypothetical protein
MNVGEMQRKLSLWATQDKERKFYGLYDLLYDGDCGRYANPVIRRKLRLTDKWRAVCGESRKHGSEGGVGKHDL